MPAGTGRTEPTNAKGRALFATLSPEARDRVRARADELYDGTRTVAQCWKEALAEAARPASTRPERAPEKNGA